MAADLAAAFTRSNGTYLEQKFGRMPSPGELYIAHFLGPQGAEKLFNAGLEDSSQVAAKLFPRQAKANQQIFYSGDHARTIKEVYRALVAKHDGAAPDPTFVAQQLASGPMPPRWPVEAVPSRFGPADMSFTSLFATDAASFAPKPLIATDAPKPLIATDALNAFAAPDASEVDALSYGPLPAPPPLLAEGLMPLLADGPIPLLADDMPPQSAEDAIPAPRVLMSTPPAEGWTSAFLTQLYARR